MLTWLQGRRLTPDGCFLRTRCATFPQYSAAPWVVTTRCVLAAAPPMARRMHACTGRAVLMGLTRCCPMRFVAPTGQRTSTPKPQVTADAAPRRTLGSYHSFRAQKDGPAMPPACVQIHPHSPTHPRGCGVCGVGLAVRGAACAGWHPPVAVALAFLRCAWSRRCYICLPEFVLATRLSARKK